MMHKNWKFHHVAVIVKDMNQAIEHYKSLGIGPFPTFIGPSGPTPLTEKMVNGKPVDYSIDLRHADSGVGDLCFELIEPLEGETPVKEFLGEKGEGIHHIGFTVDDIDRETTKMAEKGYKVTQSGVTPGARWAYFDTDALGGVVIELIQLTPK